MEIREAIKIARKESSNCKCARYVKDQCKKCEALDTLIDLASHNIEEPKPFPEDLVKRVLKIYGNVCNSKGAVDELVLDSDVDVALSEIKKLCQL